MQRKFFTNLIILIFANILVKPISLFVIDAGFQNTLGHEQYGLYFSLLNFSLLFNIILDLGINNYTTRRVAQNPEKAKRLFGTVFLFRFILFLFYILIIFSIAVLIGYEGEALHILFLLGFNQFIIIAIAYFRSHFAGFHYFKLDAMLSIMDRFLLIILGLYILEFYSNNHEINIFHFVWIQFFTYLISFIIAFFLFILYIEKPKFNWNFKLSIQIIKRSFPYALLIVLMLCYSRIDSVMLERLHEDGAKETGIYAQGFRLLDAFYMFGMLFAGLLFPMFSRLLKQNSEGVNPLIKASGNLLVGGAILLSIVSFYNSDFILGLIYDDYQEALNPFTWLMFGFVAICMNFIFGTLLTASGDLKVLIWISFFGIVINILLNYIFIAKYGALGTAIIAFITQFFTAISQAIYALQKFSIQFSIRGFAKYPILILCLILLGEFLNQLEGFFFIQVLFGTGFLFLLSFIQIGNLKELLKFKK